MREVGGGRKRQGRGGPRLSTTFAESEHLLSKRWSSATDDGTGMITYPFLASLMPRNGSGHVLQVILKLQNVCTKIRSSNSVHSAIDD